MAKGERDSDDSDLRLLDSGRRCCHRVHLHVAVPSLTAAPGCLAFGATTVVLYAAVERLPLFWRGGV